MQMYKRAYSIHTMKCGKFNKKTNELCRHYYLQKEKLFRYLASRNYVCVWIINLDKFRRLRNVQKYTETFKPNF